MSSSSATTSIQKLDKINGPRTSISVCSDTLPPFVANLWNMVESGENHIKWSLGGTAFSIRDEKHFERALLPKFYKHNKMASFLRQLNMYGFKRIGDSGLVWAHPAFRRDRPNWLGRVSRKPTEKKSSSTESLPDEDRNYEDLEQKLESLVRQQRIDSRRMQELQNELKEKEKENALLKESLDKSVRQVSELVSVVLANRNLRVDSNGSLSTDSIPYSPAISEVNDQILKCPSSHSDCNDQQQLIPHECELSPIISPATETPSPDSPHSQHLKFDLDVEMNDSSETLNVLPTHEQHVAWQMAFLGGLSAIAATQAATHAAMISAMTVSKWSISTPTCLDVSVDDG